MIPYLTRIEYIETGGNCLYTTSCIPQGGNIKISTKFLFNGWAGSGSWYSWYSAYTNEDSQVYRVMRTTSGQYGICVNNGSKASGSVYDAPFTASVGTIYTIETNGRSVTVNNTHYTTRVIEPTANTSPMRIFHNYFKGRFYYMKIYDGDELILDLFPVRIGNKGYLYDALRNELIDNSLTGTPILGPDTEVIYANEVAFLESWGNQYIDTGIKPSTDTKIELKCLYCKSGAGLTSYGSLIGADDRSNAYILNHSAVANFTYGLEFSNNFANPQTRLLTFDSTASPQNMRVYDEGGSLVTTLTCLRGVFEVNQNLYLFATNRNGTPVYGSNRIMYCKIYDGDTLLRDYVPVEYNGIGYMYDKVSGLFFDNQGTGKFLFGSIAKACARSYTRRQLMMEYAGYKRLSYISNEGYTAGGVFPYINLGIKITPTMRLYTDVQVISKGLSAYIHGVNSTPRVSFEAVWNPSQSGYYLRATANSVGYSPTTAYAKTRAQLTLDKTSFTVVRGGSTFTSAVTAGDNFKTNANFCLFFATGYQLSWGVHAMRMWSFKIWDNDVLIMDLVPVMDKGTKKIGLLNIVNHKFYGPARGTFVGA